MAFYFINYQLVFENYHVGLLAIGQLLPSPSQFRQISAKLITKAESTLSNCFGKRTNCGGGYKNTHITNK